MKTLTQRLLIIGYLSLILIFNGCQDAPPPIPVSTISDSKLIALNPIAQQTEIWCWAAVSEMILRYNGYLI